MPEKKSFWARLFNVSHQSRREEKVLEYIVHRMNDGAKLRDVVAEESVRRNLSRSQIEDIVSNPRLIETVRERMQQAFQSGQLKPNRRPQ